MSLVVPVEFLQVKQNGQFCTDGNTDYAFVSTGHVQVMGVPQLPGARIQSSFSNLSPAVHLPVAQRMSPLTEEPTFSKNIIHSKGQGYALNTGSVSLASKYVGLPYQDHNYVQLPPSTPPLSPLPLPPPTPAAPKSNIVIDDVSYDTTIVATPDDSITRCICEFQHDDGYMIQCDQCGVWQHVDCMEVDRNNIPDSYMCELCEPRRVDKHRAIQIQTRKRDALSIQHMDSSATETEDETTDGRRRSFDKSPVKKEPKEGCSGTGAGGGIVTLALAKKRKTKSKRDERLKRKLHLKRHQSNGQKLSVSSPKKCLFEPLVIDGLGEAGRQDAGLPQNGALVMSVSSLNVTPSSSVEVYQEAVSNYYTVELQNLLASIKFNNQQVSACLPSVYERLQLGPPPCLVAPVSSTRMGLEACEDILTNQPLIEYIGKVMLRDQYDKDNLFYLRAEPNVLFYSKLGGLDLCIDASSCGNMARFIRRSCTPNAEVRHLLEGSTVRFLICATKSIVRGAEITIPFDFNYHKCCYVVDCACTRISCPVAKFQRREASHTTTGSTAKRQRSAKSLETLPFMEHLTLSPKKLPSSSSFSSSSSSSVAPMSKHNKISLLSSFKTEAISEIEVVKTEPDVKPEPDSVKAEPVSPTWPLRSSNPAVSLEGEPSCPANPTTAGSNLQSLTTAVSDADETDKSKKKTREEKKLEAVMKMFERLEKQQERKKEAQSRHEHTKGKEATKTRESRKSKDKSDNKNVNETQPADVKPPSADVPSVVHKQPEQTLTEVPVKTETRSRMRHSKHGAAASRRASMSVISSTLTHIHPPHLMSFGDSDSHQSAAGDAAVATADETVDSCTVPLPVALPTTSPASEIQSLLSSSTERWTGFPKKLLMKGQDLSRQLSIKTEGLDSGGGGGGGLLDGDCSREFVQCVPSPHSCSLNTLRRNSMPAFNSATCGNGKATLLALPSVVNGGAQPDSKGCSAKKRWLQQAMCDRTELQPVCEDSALANRQSTASDNLLTDFVTPLKKRRLARESLSIDSPPPSMKPEVSTQANSVYPQYESISDDEHADVDITPGTSVETVDETKGKVVNVWENTLLAKTKDVEVLRGSEDCVTRTPLSMPVDVSQALLRPEAFLLMPVGYQCQSQDNRSAADAMPSSGGIAAMPNGFGSGLSIDLTGIQAWQKPILNIAASGIESRLSVTNPYTSTGYLSGLMPVAAQKQESLNMSGLIDYRLTFTGMEPAYSAPRQSSLNPATPLTVGISTDPKLSKAEYLNKQVMERSLNSEGGVVGTVHPMSMFHSVDAQHADIQGILALAEAACRRSEKMADSRDLNGGPQQASLHKSSKEEFRDGRESSGNLLSVTSCDQRSKIHGYFGASSQEPNFLVQNCEAGRLLSPPNGSAVVSNFSGLGTLSVNGNANNFLIHPSATGVSLADWRGLSVTGSEFLTTATTKSERTDCVNEGICINTSDLPASVSSALSSPTAGQCLSKKKVSLHEYKMRRKSGSSTQQRLLSGSSADSESSLLMSFDAAISPLLQPALSTALPSDANRDMVDGRSLVWNTDATEAEKAMEKLTNSEKFFRIDKNNTIEGGLPPAPSSLSCTLATKGCHQPQSLTSPVLALSALRETSATSSNADRAGTSAAASALRSSDASQFCNAQWPSCDVGQKHMIVSSATPVSEAPPCIGGSSIPVFALTSAFSEAGRSEASAQTASDFTRKSENTFLIQR